MSACVSVKRKKKVVSGLFGQQKRIIIQVVGRRKKEIKRLEMKSVSCGDNRLEESRAPTLDGSTFESSRGIAICAKNRCVRSSD